MKIFRILFFPIVLMVACQSSVSEKDMADIMKFASLDTSLQDGLYHVVDGGIDTLGIVKNNPNAIRISFSSKFSDSDTVPPEKITIDRSEFVPLMLKEAPDSASQPDKRKILFLNLTKFAAERLKYFSTRNLHKKATIVVNGEALTVHKIQMVIENGQLQITRCTDNACELLYFELQDNIEKNI